MLWDESHVPTCWGGGVEVPVGGQEAGHGLEAGDGDCAEADLAVGEGGDEVGEDCAEFWGRGFVCVC